MKLRGNLGGLSLRLESTDTPEDVRSLLSERAKILSESVTIEFSGSLDPALIAAATEGIAAAGGTVSAIKAVAPLTEDSPAQTVILPGNVRSGYRGDFGGSVLILGDVNPGAEVVAAGDVIVLGALRGMAHAGSEGNEQAIVWARPIATAQIRIAGAVARAPEGSSLPSMKTVSGNAEIARLSPEGILIEPYHASEVAARR